MADSTVKTPTKKPSGKVSGLTVSWGGSNRLLTASWKVSSALTSKSGEAGKKRTTFLRVEWHLRLYKPAAKKYEYIRYVSGNINVSSTSATFDLDSFYINGSGKWVQYARADFYPLAKKPLLTRVTCKVFCCNDKGSSTGGSADATYAFMKPGRPSVSGLTQAHDSGHITFRITAYDGKKTAHERYDTRYKVDVYDSRTKKTTTLDGTFTAASKSFTSEIDIADRMQLTYDQYVRVAAKAMSRGFAGMSDGLAVGTNNESKAWTAEHVLFVSYPRLPSIKAVTVSKDKNGKVTTTCKVTATIDLNSNGQHPSTGCMLQVLRGTSATTAAQATASDEWADTTAVDDGQCTALALAVADVAPVDGTHTWLRVKSWNQHEDLFYRYSAPVEAKALYVPPVTAANDRIEILSLASAGDGRSMTVRMGVNQDSANTGIEMQWSTSSDGWQSDDGHVSAEYLGAGSVAKAGSAAAKAKYKYGRTLVVPPPGSGDELDPGTTYYFRARLYRTDDDGTTYSPLCTVKSATTESASDDKCTIVSHTVDSDELGVTIQIGINEDTANDGTEVSWSDYSGAWSSNAQPESFDFAWLHGASQTITGYTKSTWLHIRGLESGKTYYVRARRYLGDGDARTYTNYSPTYKVTMPADAAEVMSEAASKVGIVSALTGTDGESAVVVVGYTEDVECTGTEVSWADTADAWESTDQPSTYAFDWADTTRRSTAYAHTAAVTLRGLKEGTLYYVRARRYLDSDSGDSSHTAWSAPVEVTPVSQPESVTLTVPGFVPRGKGCRVTWAYDSSSQQTAWQLVTGTVANGAIVDAGLKVVARGRDDLGACAIDAARLTALAGNDDTLPLAVRVSTGGAWVQSAAANVRIADPPTLTVADPSALTAQPLSLTATCNVRARLAVVARVSAGGCQGSGPGGDVVQAGGDVVWQDVITPEWAESGTSWTATIGAPAGLDLVDGGEYVVTITPTDTDTALTGDAVDATFAVAWAHQAPEPSATVEPYDTIDADGNRSRGVTIKLAATSSMVSTDVYDVYRVTPGGAYLVAEGAATDATVTDPYAPFGGEVKAYRVVTRTADGDVDWLDFEYDLAGSDLRVDFGGEYVELPYNLKSSESYGKDFELRRKLDGSMDGYWNAGVEHSASLSTDLIRILEQDKAAAVRRLAAHVGPCFVRTPDGMAYMADVQVSPGWSYDSSALPVALDATEIDLTAEYMAVVTPAEEVTP